MACFDIAIIIDFAFLSTESVKDIKINYPQKF